MATFVDLVDALAAALGMPRAVVDSLGRALREDGMIAARPVGRGARTVHVTAREAVNLVLALCAVAPSKAPALVRALRGLVPDCRIEERMNGGGSRFAKFGQRHAFEGQAHTLADQLEQVVEKLAEVDPAERRRAEAVMTAGNCALIVTADPASAAMVWDEDGKSESYFYRQPDPEALQGELLPVAPTPAPRAALRRQILIPLALFVVAADMVADSHARQPTELPAPVGAGERTPDPKTAPAGQNDEGAAPGRAAPSDGVAHGQAEAIAGTAPIQAAPYDVSAGLCPSHFREDGHNSAGAGHVDTGFSDVGPPSARLRAA